MLTEVQARELVEEEMKRSSKICSTQEILDSGVVPRLKGYVVRPGKVSDSIFGGKFSYFDKKKGEMVEAENPPLDTKDGTPLRIMVRTMRISTHDINRGDIPFKDQILAMNHDYMRRMLIPILGTSQIDVGLGDKSVVIAAENLEQIPFENVLRAYMAKSTTETSLYQAWKKGEKTFAGHKIPEDIIPNGKLPYVMDTPSTKSDEHDMTVEPKWLYEHGIFTQREYEELKKSSLEGFDLISKFLEEKGLILVDTKTEHGRTKKGKIVGQDEFYTMDSSRYWRRSDYDEQMEKLKRGEIQELNPTSYSKEFARGFSKGDQGYTDEQRFEIGVRYVIGGQNLIGIAFEPERGSRDTRVIVGLERVVERLVPN